MPSVQMPLWGRVIWTKNCQIKNMPHQSDICNYRTTNRKRQSFMSVVPYAIEVKRTKNALRGSPIMTACSGQVHDSPTELCKIFFCTGRIKELSVSFQMDVSRSLSISLNFTSSFFCSFTIAFTCIIFRFPFLGWWVCQLIETYCTSM